MKVIKSILALIIVCAFSIGTLWYVHDITEEPIAQARENIKTAAYKQVFADAASFNELPGFDTSLATVYINNRGYKNVSIDDVLVANNAAGEALGYAFIMTSTEGYGGDITLVLGIRNDATINGIEFMSINEATGLGMKADSTEFKSQFSGMNVSQVTSTKSKKQNDYEIEAISGATQTTDAVTNAVNAGLTYFGTLSGGATNE